MSLPLLAYPLSSQNHRVEGYEVLGDEALMRHNADDAPKGTEIENLIFACYRQVFNEQQVLRHHRQPVLESQLRLKQITVREFIRGLALSDSFRRLNYEVNNNYRFVELCIQRLLGRPVYNEQEKIAWSIVLATQGLRGFVNALLNSDEYLEQFGETVVPYQRRRILPQRSLGNLPFTRTARYDQRVLAPAGVVTQSDYIGSSVIDRSAAIYRRVILTVSTVSVAMFGLTLFLVAAPR